MKRQTWRRAWPLACLLVLSACAGTQPQSRSLSELSGGELYQQLCASCHGPDGRGDGPVAPLIKIGVPDLTHISLRDGGIFPEENVRRMIDGRIESRAHGPRDMPVWGWQLYFASSEHDTEARARTDALITRLVDYLRSIQTEG